MRCRVLKHFDIDGRRYVPGLIELTPELAADADELVKLGWLIVFDARPPTVPLLTPEAGQRLTYRGVPA